MIYGPHNEEAILKILIILYPASRTVLASCAAEQHVIEMNGAPPPTLYPAFPLKRSIKVGRKDLYCVCATTEKKDIVISQNITSTDKEKG